jgi:hypothetical protein
MGKTRRRRPCMGCGHEGSQGRLINFLQDDEDIDMGILTKHPLVLLGLGLVVGAYAYKHRKEIAEAAAQGSARAREAFTQAAETSPETLAVNPE